MTQNPNNLVIPEPESLGFRVTRSTPLAHLVAALRRENPRAPYSTLRVAAERLRAGQGIQGPRPDRSDSGTDSGAQSRPQTDRGVTTAPESAVAEPDPARLDEIEHGKVKRAEAAAWARDNGYDVPAKGFLPAAVITAYRAAMRDEYMASLTPVEYADGRKGEPMPADVPPTEVH